MDPLGTQPLSRADDRPVPHLDETTLLRALVSGTVAQVGEDFLRQLVRNLAETLQVDVAWVTEYLPERDVLRARAMWMDREYVSFYEHRVAGTVCEAVIRGGTLKHYPDNLIELFGQDDNEINQHRIVSYIGQAVHDADGRVIGHLAAMDRKPMADDDRLRGIFSLFAVRAAAEIRRLNAEQALREREQQLARLVDGVMDGVLELDESLAITQANSASAMLLGGPVESLRGRVFPTLLDESARRLIDAAITALEGDADRSTRRIGRMQVRRLDGAVVPVELGLARCPHDGATYHTLIMRDLGERERAETAIRSLSDRAAYLEEELERALHHGEIIGRSPALRQVLEDVARVAPTTATVLVLGETGTGKELIARALHRASHRRDRPFIAVNCAALPANLVESELFGHERGAFTGAVRKREGRFTLADGGTLFLDEVGELPAEAQAKLLRVLQEGVIEPVGGSAGRKVDVRVIAATHRDLAALAREGTFREDLWYRLNVVPLRVPALRERREDIALLAAGFIERCARKLGRAVPHLDESGITRLNAYDWPGNVRELEHVIERAVILGRDGDLDLARALPATTPVVPVAAGTTVMRAEQVRAIERRNLELALAHCDGRISGIGGMAELLGLPASTVASQLKSFGIKRPD